MKNRDEYQEMIETMEAGIERGLLRILSQRTGEENAISREELARMLKQLGFGHGQSAATIDRKIRYAIAMLRKEGKLICSSSGQHGYYMARDQEEYETFATTEYRSKIADMANTLNAMDRAAERRFGKRAQAGQQALF